ncbi:hypothetical protein EUGRSUZ_C01331 [Eucalyptus grandis]|uniref:Uncharacterized protein n=2 Tax=Eucalyptus grandis TaxID=71139 RepID=A0ACC3LCF9_EUCGR|nr:hypothetical protein EUGRSUZ_C01331 [Eucalyptus grandis]
MRQSELHQQETTKTSQNTRKPIYASSDLFISTLSRCKPGIADMPFFLKKKLSYIYLVLGCLSDLLAKNL